MKKYLITILTILITLPAFCQRGEKIRTLKIGYLTNQLNLDPSTAEKFWPIYRQYQDELSNVIKEARLDENDTRRGMEILDQEQKALDIKKKYNAQFAKVLSGEQLNRLYKAEKDFRQMIINQRQQRDNGPVGRPAARPGHGPSRMDRNYKNGDLHMEQRMETRPNQARPASMPQQSRPQLNNTPVNESRRR